MKKRFIYLSLLSLLIISSCGTGTYYSSNYSGFEDGIYYKPDNTTMKQQQAAEDNRLADLTQQTKNRKGNTVADTIYLDKSGTANVPLELDKSYIVLLDGESYEERLNKFNDSTYTFNITFEYDTPYYPYWDYPYYNPYFYGYGYGFGFRHYSPWHYGYNSWYFGYDPWYFGYDPFFYHGYYGHRHYWDYYGWGWDPWFDPWYYPYGPHIPGPGPRPDHPRRDAYYGVRTGSNSGTMHRVTTSDAVSSAGRTSSINQIRGNASSSVASGGTRVVSSDTKNGNQSISSGRTVRYNDNMSVSGNTDNRVSTGRTASTSTSSSSRYRPASNGNSVSNRTGTATRSSNSSSESNSSRTGYYSGNSSSRSSYSSGNNENRTRSSSYSSGSNSSRSSYSSSSYSSGARSGGNSGSSSSGSSSSGRTGGSGGRR